MVLEDTEMAKDDWYEMIQRYSPELYYITDPHTYSNAKEKCGYELNVLRDRCGRMERDLIAERQKNKKLQEQLNELLEEMREC